jgi:uncharacterized protein (DUF1684 family)
MKRIPLSLLLCCILATGLAQQKSAEEFQKETNEQYADTSNSPLLKKDLIDFKGLPFYKIDSQYIVTAKIKRIDKTKPFKMKTTTDRRPKYVVYAIATFKIKGKSHQLNIYKSYGISKPEYEDYLFLPFTDETSGNDTYGGGRFIDLRMTKGNEMVIDFNQAYNPYCAYNHNYSCPIPPKDNHLKVRIEAGVKYVSKD